MRSLLIVLFVCIAAASSAWAGETLEQGPPPAWVRPIEVVSPIAGELMEDLLETSHGLEVIQRYTVESEAGALVQVDSKGMRHAPPDVLARLGRGEDVDPSLYYFRIIFVLLFPKKFFFRRKFYVSTKILLPRLQPNSMLLGIY